jgi:hypothetical protein
MLVTGRRCKLSSSRDRLREITAPARLHLFASSPNARDGWKLNIPSAEAIFK